MMSGSPFGFSAVVTKAGQSALGRVTDHADRSERNAVASREIRRHMGFHIDRRRPGKGMQFGLRGHAHDRCVDPGEVGRVRRQIGSRQGGVNRVAQGGVGLAASRFIGNAGGDHHVAWDQRRIEPSRDAEADHGTTSGLPAKGEQRTKALRRSTRSHGLDSRAGGKPSLLGESGDDEDGEHGMSSQHSLPLCGGGWPSRQRGSGEGSDVSGEAHLPHAPQALSPTEGRGSRRAYIP